MTHTGPVTTRRDTTILITFAALILVVHFVLGDAYGFHRDELQFLDDARHLQWGFTAYPPLTSFCGRIAIALFGISPGVFRLPAAAVNATSLVLFGLIARELGGRLSAQLLTCAANFALAMVLSSLMQYTTFDLFSWTLLIFFTARLLRTEDERNWIGIGAAIGIGVLSKYAIAFPTVSLFAALAILPSQRHHLRSRWTSYGILTAAIIAAPNLIWLATHHFITIHMETFIHARDVRLGRADGFYKDQLYYTLLALPLAVAGLVSLVRSPRFRLLSAFYLGPFLLFALLRGRGYYLLPAYPVLYAAGTVALERFLAPRRPALRIAARAVVLAAVLADTIVIARAYLPIYQPGTVAWANQVQQRGDLADEVGWPEFVAQVAAVRDQVPAQDRSRLAVLANNYGEAGALALYGPAHGLPTPISSTNSFWARGFGPYEPETVIVTGSTLEDQLKNFERCTVAAHVQIPWNVRNEESADHPDILLCHHLRTPWPATWAKSQAFG